MEKITRTSPYSELTRLHQTGALFQTAPVRPSLAETDRQALEAAQATARKVLSTGVAGDKAQQATATVAKLEQLSQLSQGDVNAVTLKAAVDLGEQFTRGEVQQVLSTFSAPLGTIVSVENLSTSIDKTLEKPNPQNLKTLMNSTVGATTSVGQLSQLIAKHTGEAGRLLARGSQSLGQLNSVLSVGVAAMDVAIAGQDIQRFWQDPNLKSFSKMGLGLVAASASVLSAAKVPGLGTKALVVAALADAGKMAVDVDWGAVYQGVTGTVSAVAQSQAVRLKQDLLESRLPAGRHPLNRRLVQVSSWN